MTSDTEQNLDAVAAELEGLWTAFASERQRVWDNVPDANDGELRAKLEDLLFENDALPALLEERKRLREAFDAVKPFAEIGQMVADAWPEGSFEIDGIELQELLTEHGLIAAVPGGFNSNIHTDWNAQAPEEGDEWLMPTALDAKARAALTNQ